VYRLSPSIDRSEQRVHLTLQADTTTTWDKCREGLNAVLSSAPAMRFPSRTHHPSYPPAALASTTQAVHPLQPVHSTPSIALHCLLDASTSLTCHFHLHHPFLLPTIPHHPFPSLLIPSLHCSSILLSLFLCSCCLGTVILIIPSSYLAVSSSTLASSGN
jgi:hypothetical protein